MADLSSTDATFLFVGSRDGAAEAVFALLGERGAELEWSDVDGAKELSFVLAPDVLVLVGTAAAGGGAVAIETLQEQGIDEELTIAVLSDGDVGRRSADAAGAKGVLLQSPHRAADDLIRVALGEPVPLPEAPKAEAKVEAPKPEAKPAPKAEPAKVAAPKPTKPAVASAEPTKPAIVAPPAAKPEVAKPAAAKPIVAKPGIAPRPAAVALPPGASKPEPKAEAKPEPKPKVEPKVEAKPIARPPSVAPPARPASVAPPARPASVPPPARAPSVPPRPASVPPPAAFPLDDDEVRIPSAPPLPPGAVVDARSEVVGGDLVGGELVESLPPSLVPPPRAEAKPPELPAAKAEPPKPPEPPKGGPPRPPEPKAPVAPKPAPPKVDADGPASADDWRDLPSFAGDPLAAAPPPASPEKAPLPVLPPPAASPSPIVAAPAISEPLRLSDPPPAEGNRQVLLLLGAATAVVVVIGGAAWALMPEEPPPRTYHPVHLTAPPPIVPPPRPDVPIDAGMPEDEEEVSAGDRGSIDELINGANYNRQHGALDRAEEGYRAVLELDARNQRALVGMARVALARGDHTTALTWTRMLTTEHPRSASNQVLLGDVLRASGDRDGARRAYEQALAIAPSNATARERLDAL